MDTMNKTFEYGDLSAVFDASDYTVMERYQAAANALSQACTMIGAGDASPLEQLREIFRAFSEFVDAVFGAGSACLAIGNSTSVNDITSVVHAIGIFVLQQTADITAQWNAMQQMYSEAANPNQHESA